MNSTLRKPSQRLLFVALSVWSAHLSASLITGVVSDEAGPLTDAEVVHLESGQRTKTDAGGRYFLRNIPEGIQQIRFSYIGAESVVESLEVGESDRYVLNIEMEPVMIELEPFEVTARDEGAARALNAQRVANAQVTVSASDALGRFPDQNLAESLQRLPGISLEKDQGEGRYVSIRGVDPDLSNIAINGVSMPAPEAESRAVALDVIPSDILDLVEVKKVITADMDGDAIGGSINVKTKSALDEGKRFGKLSLEGYYNDLVARTSGKISGIYGDVFGADKNMGFVIAASFEERHLGSHNVEVDGAWSEQEAADLSRDYFASEIEFRDYEVDRKRYAVSGGFEISQPDAHYYIRSLYSYFSDQEDRYRLEIKPDEGDIDTISYGAATVSEVNKFDRDIKDRFEEQEIWSINLGGTNYVGSWTIDYQLAYSHAEELEPDHLDTDFRMDKSEKADIRYDFNQEDGYVPTIEVLSGADIYGDASLYEFEGAEWINGISEDDEWAVQVNLRYDLMLGSFPAFLKSGLKYRDREKKHDVDVDVYDGVGGAANDFGLGTPGIAGNSLRYPYGNGSDGSFLRGNSSQVRSFFIEHRSDFELVDEDTWIASTEDDYSSSEAITAGYLMGSVNMNDLTIVAGARIEHTAFKTEGREIIFDKTKKLVVSSADGAAEVTGIDDIPFLAAQSDYTDVLPSVVFRYEPVQDLIIRLSWSNTIARPKFKDSAIRQETKIKDREVEVGNPSLNPYESMNWDFSVEYYYEPLGLVSVSLFRKDISQFIYDEKLEDGISVGGVQFDLKTPLNGREAEITGIELAWQQELSVLSDMLSGFSIYANATLSDGEADIGKRLVPMLKHSEEVYTVAISFEKWGFYAKLASTYRSDYLDTVGDGVLEDEIIDGNFQLDLDLEYDVTKDFTVYLEAINLTNEPKRTYYGSGMPRQYEEYSWGLKTGVKWSF